MGGGPDSRGLKPPLSKAQTRSTFRFRENHAYFPVILDGGETTDGRTCYDFEISNIGLVSTQQLPNPPSAPIDAGTNNIFIYATMGFQGRMTGEVNLVHVHQIQYSTTAPFQTPASPISIGPEDFFTAGWVQCPSP